MFPGGSVFCPDFAGPNLANWETPIEPKIELGFNNKYITVRIYTKI